MFSGCTSSDTDHAITVVGYGTADNGEKYWLIKNSWSVLVSPVCVIIIMILYNTRGADWGEGGYIRLKKGVGMCGIGRAIATVECQKVAITE